MAENIVTQSTPRATSQERPAYASWAPSAPEGRFDANLVVPGDGPLEVDVGFGRGRSLFSRADVNPTGRLLGIERKPKWVFKVHERLRREERDHVRVVAGDARDILSRLEPAGCIERVYVHFPDPWWKKRHDKRKVVNAAFLSDVARLLSDGGEFFLQTDVRERAIEYRALCNAHSELVLGGDDGWVTENPFGSVSNRECRADADGLPVYRLLTRRRPRHESPTG